MEPNRVAVNPALLQRFDDEFAKSGLSFMMKELNLRGFAEYVDVPLSTLHARGYNESLGASWQCERRQQISVSATTLTLFNPLQWRPVALTDANTADTLMDNDIFMASQQFKQNVTLIFFFNYLIIDH